MAAAFFPELRTPQLSKFSISSKSFEVQRNNEEICYKYWEVIVGNKSTYFSVISLLSCQFKELTEISTCYINIPDKVSKFML